MTIWIRRLYVALVGIALSAATSIAQVPGRDAVLIAVEPLTLVESRPTGVLGRTGAVVAEVEAGTLLRMIAGWQGQAGFGSQVWVNVQPLDDEGQDDGPSGWVPWGTDVRGPSPYLLSQ